MVKAKDARALGEIDISSSSFSCGNHLFDCSSSWSFVTSKMKISELPDHTVSVGRSISNRPVIIGGRLNSGLLTLVKSKYTLSANQNGGSQMAALAPDHI